MLFAEELVVEGLLELVTFSGGALFVGKILGVSAGVDDDDESPPSTGRVGVEEKLAAAAAAAGGLQDPVVAADSVRSSPLEGRHVGGKIKFATPASGCPSPSLPSATTAATPPSRMSGLGAEGVLCGALSLATVAEGADCDVLLSQKTSYPSGTAAEVSFEATPVVVLEDVSLPLLPTASVSWSMKVWPKPPGLPSLSLLYFALSAALAPAPACLSHEEMKKNAPISSSRGRRVPKGMWPDRQAGCSRAPRKLESSLPHHSAPSQGYRGRLWWIFLLTLLLRRPGLACHTREPLRREISFLRRCYRVVSSSQYNLCVRPGEMAAPSSTVPCPTNAGVDVLTYVEEVVVGAAMLLQQAPVVGDVCAMFLSFQQLVETAKSNTEDLEVLRDLCDVVIKGVLDKRSDRSGLLKGFAALEKHVKKAEEVSKLCNGAGIRDTIRRCLLARKISGDIQRCAPKHCRCFHGE